MIDLNKMFKPESVAVIGASNTPGKVGYIIVDNLINDGFEGEIYPVNPKGGEILGKKAYANIADVPGDVDLVIITIPSPFVNTAVKVVHQFLLGRQLVVDIGCGGQHTAVSCRGGNGTGIHQRHSRDLTVGGFRAFTVGEVSGGMTDGQGVVGGGIA